MGQKISSSSFSCMNCGSRLVTLEDNETSPKFKTRDFFFQDFSDDLNDEITVFESPVKEPKKHDQSQTLDKTSILDSSHEVLTMPGSNSGDSDREKCKLKLALRLKAIKNSSVKTQEEYLLSENSTPSNSSFLTSRSKAYSSNFSPVSVNLVENIRKTSDSHLLQRKNSDSKL